MPVIENRSPECIVFDFDGTLAASLDVWDTVLLKYIEIHGLAAWPEAPGLCSKRNINDTAALFIEHYSLKDVCSAPAHPPTFFPKIILSVSLSHFFPFSQTVC